MECSKNTQKPWLLIGDFNQFTRALEKFSSNKSLEGALVLQEVIFQVGLIEIKSFGTWFTWTNNRIGQSLVIERLDKAFYNQMWLSQYPESHVLCLPIAASDHSPLIFDTTHQQNYKKHDFHFQNYWLTHQIFNELVANVWNSMHTGSLVYQVTGKLNDT